MASVIENGKCYSVRVSFYIFTYLVNISSIFGRILLKNISFPRVGIETTTSRFYSHTMCPCATTGLDIITILKYFTILRSTLLQLSFDFFYKLLRIYKEKQKVILIVSL